MDADSYSLSIGNLQFAGFINLFVHRCNQRPTFDNFLHKNIYKKSCYILISYDKHFPLVTEYRLGGNLKVIYDRHDDAGHF
jgi:hypothetical protein